MSFTLSSRAPRRHVINGSQFPLAKILLNSSPQIKKQLGPTAIMFFWESVTRLQFYNKNVISNCGIVFHSFLKSNSYGALLMNLIFLLKKYYFPVRKWRSSSVLQQWGCSSATASRPCPSSAIDPRPCRLLTDDLLLFLDNQENLPCNIVRILHPEFHAIMPPWHHSNRCVQLKHATTSAFSIFRARIPYDHVCMYLVWIIG